MTNESDHVRLVLIEARMQEMAEQMEMQVQATRDLVDAWQSAKTLIAFVQLLAKIGAAGAALWLMAKGIAGVWK